MNINDVGLFRSLDVSVRKLRRGSGNLFDIINDNETMVEVVLQVVNTYYADKLCLIWNHKAEGMGKVVLFAGGGDYDRHSLRVPE